NHQSHKGFRTRLPMGCWHGNTFGESPEQRIDRSQSYFARPQRLRLHHDVPHYTDPFALGAGESCSRQCCESDLSGRAHSQVRACGARPHAFFTLASNKRPSLASSRITENPWQTKTTSYRRKILPNLDYSR